MKHANTELTTVAVSERTVQGRWVQPSAVPGCLQNLSVFPDGNSVPITHWLPTAPLFSGLPLNTSSFRGSDLLDRLG